MTLRIMKNNARNILVLSRSKNATVVCICFRVGAQANQDYNIKQNIKNSDLCKKITTTPGDKGTRAIKVSLPGRTLTQMPGDRQTS